MEDQKNQALRESASLLGAARTATLSVLDPDTGGPYGALVNVALDEAQRPLILVSTLSRHTKALLKDARASLMFHGELPKVGDPLTGLRLTLAGEFEKTDDGKARTAYLARHPYAELYAGFGDFSIWRMTADKLYVVAGFGRVYTYDAAELRKLV